MGSLTEEVSIILKSASPFLRSLFPVRSESFLLYVLEEVLLIQKGISSHSWGVPSQFFRGSPSNFYISSFERF